MNTEHILAVVDQIELYPGMFHMNEVGNISCGTPGCIAGFAVFLQECRGVPFSEVRLTNWLNSQEFLGLSKSEMRSLCLPAKDDLVGSVWHKYAGELGLKEEEIKNFEREKITYEMAVHMLRNLANRVWEF